MGQAGVGIEGDKDWWWVLQFIKLCIGVPVWKQLKTTALRQRHMSQAPPPPKTRTTGCPHNQSQLICSPHFFFVPGPSCPGSTGFSAELLPVQCVAVATAADFVASPKTTPKLRSNQKCACLYGCCCSRNGPKVPWRSHFHPHLSEHLTKQHEGFHVWH